MYPSTLRVKTKLHGNLVDVWISSSNVSHIAKAICWNGFSVRLLKLKLPKFFNDRDLQQYK